jgi:hypothetical protein
LSKSGLKLVCNVKIVYRNLKSENSQDYGQKPQRNCTSMNSASGKRLPTRAKRLLDFMILLCLSIISLSLFTIRTSLFFAGGEQTIYLTGEFTLRQEAGEFSRIFSSGGLRIFSRVGPF